jgi:hypothetical protein
MPATRMSTIREGPCAYGARRPNSNLYTTLTATLQVLSNP